MPRRLSLNCITTLRLFAGTLLALCLAACSVQRLPSELDLAQAHFAKGETDAAFSVLERAITAAPGDLRLGNYYRARVVEHSQEDRAINFFKQLIDGQSVPDGAYYNFAFAYIDKIPRVGPMGAGFLSKRSIAQFKVVQERVPDDWIANYGIGMNYLHWPDYFKKTEGALGYFEKCLQIQENGKKMPRYLLTYLRMGDALVRAGQLDAAYDVWQRGLLKFPKHADLLDRIETPRDRIEATIRELYNPNNSIGAIDTDISILWAHDVPEHAVPLRRNVSKQAGVGGQLRDAEAPDRAQVDLFSWFTRNLPYLSDRNSASKADMSVLGVQRGTGLEGRINSIAYGMISGFMAELEGETPSALRSKSQSIDSFTRPFFHEGLGMGYAAAVSLDNIEELKGLDAQMRGVDQNFQRLHLAGAGMWFGLESARPIEQVAEAFRKLGPFGEAYAYEGYGFARTLFYFQSNRQVINVAERLRPEAAANYFHGVGRAFWILSGGDTKRGVEHLQLVGEALRSHAYSGFAMGMAFTQIDDLDAVLKRVEQALPQADRGALLAGVAMGLYIRQLGDPSYVESQLGRAAAHEQCVARELLSVGASALEDAESGAGDLHANWRAAIEKRIAIQFGPGAGRCV